MIQNLAKALLVTDRLLQFSLCKELRRPSNSYWLRRADRAANQRRDGWIARLESLGGSCRDVIFHLLFWGQRASKVHSETVQQCRFPRHATTDDHRQIGAEEESLGSRRTGLSVCSREKGSSARNGDALKPRALCRNRIRQVIPQHEFPGRVFAKCEAKARVL